MMKRYEDLTPEEQESALGRVVNMEVAGCLEMWKSEFPDGEANAAFDNALAKATGLQTPWFAAEYVRDEPLTIQGEEVEGGLISYIRKLCQPIIEESVYPSLSDIVIEGIC